VRRADRPRGRSNSWGVRRRTALAALSGHDGQDFGAGERGIELVVRSIAHLDFDPFEPGEVTVSIRWISPRDTPPDSDLGGASRVWSV
jgi:hypothetical protein